MTSVTEEMPYGWVVHPRHTSKRDFVFTALERDRAIELGGYVTPVWAAPAQVEALARSASPVAQQRDDGWQDIATAPKDGTWFLGWAERPDVEDQYDIWHWDAEAETDAGYGFWINAADSNLDEYPTLWKPLQPPPVLSPERKDKSNG